MSVQEKYRPHYKFMGLMLLIYVILAFIAILFDNYHLIEYMIYSLTGTALGLICGINMFPKVDIDLPPERSFNELLHELEQTYTDDHIWWSCGNLEYRPGSMFWETIDNDDDED